VTPVHVGFQKASEFGQCRRVRIPVHVIQEDFSGIRGVQTDFTALVGVLGAQGIDHRRRAIMGIGGIRTSPVQALKNWQAKHPELFNKRVSNLAGLDR